MSMYGGVPLPIPLPQLTCSDVQIVLSQLSGNVTLTLHCPGDLIQPSLWTDRYTCIAYQICYLGLLIQSIGQTNSSLANELMTLMTNVANELLALSSPQSGQPIIHDYFNALVDYINMAYNVLNTYVSNILNTSLSNIPNSLNLINAVNTLTKKSIMDLMTAQDWNTVTQALQSIDQILLYIRQSILLPTMVGQVSTPTIAITISPMTGKISTPTITITTSITTSIGVS